MCKLFALDLCTYCNSRMPSLLSNRRRFRVQVLDNFQYHFHHFEQRPMTMLVKTLKNLVPAAGWIAIAIGIGVIVLLIMYCCVRKWCAKRRHGKGKDGGGGKGKGLKGFVKGVDLLPSSMKEKVSTQQVITL